jgi:large exoprotein involved in heme utilization and adhesion
VRITAGNIQLGDDDPATSLQASIGFYGDIGSRSFGSGRGGDVYITADNLTIKNGFFINTAALSLGDAGNVTVRAGKLNLLDEGSISSNGLWVGKGGIVDVIATDVLISGKNAPNVPNYTGLTGLASQTGYGSKGGLLRLTADTLQILDGGSISTVLYSIGPGADIEIIAKNILISGVVIDNRISPPDIHASIDARLVGSYASGTGGNISIVADSLQVTSGGFISSGLFGNAPGNAGGITVKAGSLEVSDRGGIFASSVYGMGNAGRLDITAKDVSIVGAKSSPDPFGKDFTGFSTATNVGYAGDLRVTADNLVVKDVGSISAASFGPGHAGNIEVNVGNVQVLNGATITSGAFSSGDGGNLDIKSDNLLLTNTGSISAASLGSGHAGNIEVNVGNVQVLNGAAIVSSAFGSGDGGGINVKANNVLVSGVNPGPYVDMAGIHPSGIASQSFINGGNAGDVQITAGSLQVLDGARISTETFGRGNGGTIQITADNVLISGLNQGVKEFLTANGADPEGASASLLTSTNGSFLGSSATGNAGNLRITTRNVRVQDGGLISSKTEYSGNGGNIEFIIDRMNLFNGATVSAESSGAGYAGNILIKATDTVLLEDSSITTEAKYTDGGNIQVNAGYKVSLVDSKITASVGGGPDTLGGNITIDPQYVILNDSQIIANAYEGKGGNIRIIADVFLASPDSIVDASSALGIDGTVDIRAPITNISGTLAPMRGNFLSAEALLRDRCAARVRGGKYSSFVVSGRDGLPIRPGSVLPSPIY